jgi:hypothetical protein
MGQTEARLTAFCFTVQDLLDVAQPLPTAVAAAITLCWRKVGPAVVSAEGSPAN